MTAPDTAALRRLAEAAHSGPWSAECGGSEGWYVWSAPTVDERFPRFGSRRHRIAAVTWGSHESDRADAEFIAALDPATVLALLDAAEAATRHYAAFVGADNERNRLEIAVDDVLYDHAHADTCATALSPDAGYPCSCWQADLRAALDPPADTEAGAP